LILIFHFDITGITQVRIDSDLRSLFAVGMIDHLEKLRKETNECKVILKGISSRLNERLKIFSKVSASEVRHKIITMQRHLAHNVTIYS